MTTHNYLDKILQIMKQINYKIHNPHDQKSLKPGGYAHL